jgi:tripartite-type tricarboxylate transporter receptor subunit TctC
MDKRVFLKAALATALPGLALAQTPGGRPVRMIVPLPAGSSNDFVARALMPTVSTLTGQHYIVENKAGGGGVIAVQDVMRSLPDGSTLMCASLSPLAVNVALVKNLPYDPLKDLTPIAGTSLTNHVLMVKASSPIRSFAEFLAHAKKNPGKVSIGYSTAVVQLQIATIGKMSGVELLPVAYKGSPATLTDVIGGTLDATLTDPGNAMAQVKGGNMRALAVSSLKRNPSTPDWPAISETLPGFDFPSWNAVVGPANMPRDLVNRISVAMAQGLRNKDVVERYASVATIPLILNPDELKAYMQSEVDKWVRLAREAQIQPE